MEISRNGNVNYRPEIDGLRAVAVVPVLLYHAKLGCPGGYIGVDVFFVISGYLITSLILKEFNTDTFSFLTFWERRVRRILPAVVAVISATLAAGWFLLLPEDFRDLGRSVVAQALMLANVYFWRESGYFDAPAEAKPLLHFWSLAVEEQFYLLLPLLLLGLRCLRTSHLRLCLGALTLASFALSVYGTGHHRGATFYLLPTRAWELLIGCLIATVPASGATRHQKRWVLEIVSTGGLIVILTAAFVYDRQTLFPGAAALPPCLGTAAVIWANGRRLTWTARLLKCRPVVFIGLISYSLYLWHWPMLVYAQYWALENLSVLQRGSLVGASFVAAALSWMFVETPFRMRWVCLERAALFAAAGMCLCVLLACGTSIDRFDGFRWRFTTETLTLADGRLDKGPDPTVVVEPSGEARFNEIGSPNDPLQCLVWGDSHTLALIPVMEQLCREHRARCVSATYSASSPLVNYRNTSQYSLLDKSIAFSNSVVDFVQAERVPNVLLAARWSRHGFDTEDGIAGLPDESLEDFRQHLAETVATLQDSGAKVWILQQVPYQRVDVPRALARASIFGTNPNDLGVLLSEHRRRCAYEAAIIREMIDLGAEVLDPCELLADESGLCRAERSGRSLYRDRHHLSVFGAMQLKSLFETIFAVTDRSSAL